MDGPVINAMSVMTDQRIAAVSVHVWRIYKVSHSVSVKLVVVVQHVNFKHVTRLARIMVHASYRMVNRNVSVMPAGVD